MRPQCVGKDQGERDYQVKRRKLQIDLALFAAVWFKSTCGEALVAISVIRGRGISIRRQAVQILFVRHCHCCLPPSSSPVGPILGPNESFSECRQE